MDVRPARSRIGRVAGIVMIPNDRPEALGGYSSKVLVKTLTEAAEGRWGMATDVRIVHSHDVVRSMADGKLDLGTSRSLLAKVAAAGEELDDFDVIFDARRAESAMTVGELWDLAYHLADLDVMRGRKITVLPPEQDFDRANFFARFSRTRGMRVRSFASFEEAVNWLESDRTTQLQ